MNQSKLSKCCTCGYQWVTGTYGNHNCSSILGKANKELEEKITFLQSELLGKQMLLIKAEKALSVAISGAEYHDGRNSIYFISEVHNELSNNSKG